jgi:glucose-1-phosphate thymidylyltransferase
MDGVVLAAGEGTRMRPLTADTPKALVPVAGEPLLSYAFDSLVSVGVDRLIVVIGYRGEDIAEYYGDSYHDTPIRYVEQSKQLGTAHALKQALPIAEPPVVLMNGDNICRANLHAVVARHRDTDAAATLLVDSAPREQAQTTGVVETDAEGRPTGFVEKPDDPPSTLVTRGFSVFGPQIGPAIERIDPANRGEYELVDAVADLLDRGHRIETVRLSGWCCNVNTPGERDRVAERLSDT